MASGDEKRGFLSDLAPPGLTYVTINIPIFGSQMEKNNIVTGVRVLEVLQPSFVALLHPFCNPLSSI